MSKNAGLFGGMFLSGVVVVSISLGALFGAGVGCLTFGILLMVVALGCIVGMVDK